jgi:RNA recognition motif-containing protein
LVKAWDERFMEMYPTDSLEVKLFNSDFKKQR